MERRNRKGYYRANIESAPKFLLAYMIVKQNSEHICQFHLSALASTSSQAATWGFGNRQYQLSFVGSKNILSYIQYAHSYPGWCQEVQDRKNSAPKKSGGRLIHIGIIATPSLFLLLLLIRNTESISQR